MANMAESRLSRELIERAQAGDEEAFAVIYHETQPRLEAMVYLRLGPKLRSLLETGDVLQMTYMRAHRLLPRFKYEGAGSLFGWLETISEHVIKDLGRYFRRRRRTGKHVGIWKSLNGSSELPAHGLLDLLPAPANTPSRILRRQDRFERLERALGSLSRDYREVLILARVQRLPIRDIASRMRRSEPAVQMLLLRAARELRRVMGSTDSVGLPLERLGELCKLLDPSRKDTKTNGTKATEAARDPE